MEVIPLIREVRVSDYRSAVRAIKRGAARIELNAALSVGGLTPSWANIRQTIAFAHAQSIPVIVTVRPRSGSFIYSAAEVQIIQQDTHMIAQLGADGIALGLLTSHHQINTTQLQQIVTDLPPITLIFNRAFDQINNQPLAIQWLIANNFQRIVTHGGSLNKPLNIKHLQEVIQWSHRQIEILPSGGISPGKVADILKVLNLTQIQVSNIV